MPTLYCHRKPVIACCVRQTLALCGIAAVSFCSCDRLAALRPDDMVTSLWQIHMHVALKRLVRLHHRNCLSAMPPSADPHVHLYRAPENATARKNTSASFRKFVHNTFLVWRNILMSKVCINIDGYWIHRRFYF